MDVTMNIIHHYPPELLSLLVDTIPLLLRSKKDLLIFFKGAGVADRFTNDLWTRVEKDRGSVTKYEIVRQILVRLNDAGERSLRERREILKRVTEFEDFSTCWPDDQLKAKGLVGEIRRVVNVKDSFTRMQNEHEVERQQRLAEEKTKLAAQAQKRSKLENAKKALFSLFSSVNAQSRGKQLEDVLNRLFEASDILVRDAFTRVGNEGEGVIEQVDGVVELDGEIYLVEMKWREKPLGTGQVSQHLVRVFTRDCARGILISYSDFTGPAITTCKEALSRMVVVLCSVHEIVNALEKEVDLKDFFKQKLRAAIVDKNPHGTVRL